MPNHSITNQADIIDRIKLPSVQSALDCGVSWNNPDHSIRNEFADSYIA